MASAGLLALIDDIATLLDDVALLTKVAAKKTAGVLGDDLALNAEQVSGVRAERELPVVWAVAKGSAKNKMILVPAALLLSAFAPWIVTPLLMLGGAFLCYEGFEKVAHKFLYSKDQVEIEKRQLEEAFEDVDIDLAEFEKNKIQGAIRTDFILSAEIVVIALGTVQHVDFVQQVVVVALIAAAITVGVYGTVAVIVKLDDAGLYLMRLQGKSYATRLKQKFGWLLLTSCPYLMKTLAIVGTIAMFLVGGGILLHGMPGGHELMHHVQVWSLSVAVVEQLPEFIMPTMINSIVGVVAGAVIVVLVTIASALKGVFSSVDAG